MPTPMRSRGAEEVDREALRERGRDRGTGRNRRRKDREGSVSVLRSRFGAGILVISGRSRSMYQSLEPKPGGDNLSQEVRPQGGKRTPHDTTAGQYQRNQLK